MLIGFRQPKTKDDMKTNDDVTKSAPTLANTMLNEAVFRPMLFSTPMVKALLNETKTQTRRIIKDCIEIQKVPLYSELSDFNGKYRKLTYDGEYKIIDSPVKINDIIWVRETFAELKDGHNQIWIEYKANGLENHSEQGDWKWTPSLFMPKSDSRIWLKVTNLRVERLQDISKQDAINEGIEQFEYITKDGSKLTTYKNYLIVGLEFTNPAQSYKSLWIKINGEKSWDENPFVWVYDFDVSLERPHGFI